MPQTDSNKYDAIIIGAGAAGLFCGGVLATAGKRVLIIEKSAKIGAKILISGGGRCNFTNLKVTHENFVSNNTQFARAALSAFPPEKFIEMVKSRKIPFYEKTLGQLFVSENGGARHILQMLLDLAKSAEIKTKCHVSNISKADEFEIETNLGNFTTPSLIIATGGPSIPKMGASGFAYQIAEKFGVSIIKPRPALVPLVFNGQEFDYLRDLAGIAIESIVSKGKIAFKEAVLFTHKGLSGPAILQISNYLDANDEFTINFAPQIDIGEFLIAKKQTNPNQKVSNLLSEIFPKRFAETFGNEKPINSLKDVDLRQIGARINRHTLCKMLDEGFAKAEVTRGGIDTNELNQKTFEAKKVQGLYFIGECIDMTGWLGGYNFHWAWASGFSCANAILGAMKTNNSPDISW